MSTEIAHMDWRTVMSAKPDTPDATIKALDDYFFSFAQIPIEKADDGKTIIAKQPCLKCSEPLSGGGLAESFFGKGGFEWGLAHGEGHCRGCGWPARAYHFIKDADGNDVMTIRNIVLQYHPDFVSTKRRATEDRRHD